MVKWIALLILVFFLSGLLFFLIKPAPLPLVQPSSIPKPSATTIPSPETTIIITGDIMLGRSVMGISLSKNNPAYPFEKVSQVLNKADIVFSNLENPIISNCPPSDAGFKFCADPKMLAGIYQSGPFVLNLANNHSKNYGADGFLQTEKYLRDTHIDYVGDSNLVTKDVNGTKFGFLGFDFVENEPKDTDYLLISDSKKKVDVLIVMIHWGVEYTSEPTGMQRSVAKNLVSAGADVVAGGHPHWVQGIEYFDEKPVFYSLGNFIFDQMWSEETKKGLAVKLFYDNGKLSRVEKIPIYMSSFAQPEWTN